MAGGLDNNGSNANSEGLTVAALKALAIGVLRASLNMVNVIKRRGEFWRG